MKKATSFFLSILICISFIPAPAFAVTRDTSFEESLAADLKNLGLFKGVSETNFDLGRQPTRTEALIMLIRVLGKENEAVNGNWKHSFTDVEQWADKYVGYAYEKGLTNGVSATEFGSGTASATMYLTFVLRALGYSDANGADFTWDNPSSLAKSIGVLPDCADTSSFWRADVVLISYAALPVKLKNSTQTLADKLIAAGIFTKAQYDSNYHAKAISNHNNTAPKTELTAEGIYTQCSPAVFYIEVFNAKGTSMGSGSGFFIDSNGTAVTNYHVIEGCSTAKVTVSGTGKVYDVLGVYACNKDQDWAVLKVNGSGFPYLKAGDKSTVLGGAVVYAIGCPLGLQSSISQGLISNPSRVEDGVNYIQTSAAMSSGSSGGALLNKYGEVIGITSASYVYGQNLNLAVPISYVDFSIAGKTCTSLATAAKIDPLAYLENYVVTYGDCDTYVDSAQKTFHLYTLGMGTKDSVYAINYCTETGILSLSNSYQNSAGIFSIALYLAGMDKSGPEYYVDFFAQKNGSTDKIYGYATVTASTFCSNSPYSFYKYKGNADDKSNSEKMAKNLTVNSLDATQYIFEHYHMPITIADFGFTAAYAAYNSQS